MSRVELQNDVHASYKLYRYESHVNSILFSAARKTKISQKDIFLNYVAIEIYKLNPVNCAHLVRKSKRLRLF